MAPLCGDSRFGQLVVVVVVASSLRSSGWIPDGTGKWLKDDNVEFDSDEEEPPVISPP